MYVAEFRRVELDLCGACGGVWFDRGELALLLGDEPALAAATAPDEPTRACPLCDRPLDKVNIGPGAGVVVDRCPQGCGLWFDDAEVAALAAAVEVAGGLPAAARDFLAGMFPAKGGE
jgi:Zn-finger nucleic acid-binding protein